MPSAVRRQAARDRGRDVSSLEKLIAKYPARPPVHRIYVSSDAEVAEQADAMVLFHAARAHFHGASIGGPEALAALLGRCTWGKALLEQWELARVEGRDPDDEERIKRLRDIALRHPQHPPAQVHGIERTTWSLSSELRLRRADASWLQVLKKRFLDSGLSDRVIEALSTSKAAPAWGVERLREWQVQKFRRRGEQAEEMEAQPKVRVVRRSSAPLSEPAPQPPSPPPPPPEPPTEWVCKCGRAFPTSTRYHKHARLHEEAKHFRCSSPGCGKSFKRRTHLSRHLNVHTNAKPYVCKVEGCSLSFLSEQKLKKHARSHEGLMCDVCGARFRKRLTLERHREAHLETSPGVVSLALTCPRCGIEAQDATALARHLKRHKDIYSCDKCDASFARFTELAAHQRALHPKRHICEECGKAYQREAHLREHTRRVHAEGLHMCTRPDCGQVFSTASSLQVHMRARHLGLRPFTCKWCSKTFAYRHVLRRHCEMVHAGESPPISPVQRPQKVPKRRSRAFDSPQKLDGKRPKVSPVIVSPKCLEEPDVFGDCVQKRYIASSKELSTARKTEDTGPSVSDLLGGWA